MLYHFILNPKSGRPQKQQNLEDAIKSACTKRSLNYRIYYTTCQGDASEYVSSMIRISNDKQRFICVGGDGTLNEIVNSGVLNDRAEFGVMPYGSGNDFVRNFTNSHLFRSVEEQLDAATVCLDLIKCNDTYSVNMINIGFDCAAAKEAAILKRKKLTTPAFSYTLGVLKVFFRKFGTKMRLVFDDGEVLEDNYILAAIGNGKFCGGGYCATPNAKTDDGLLDICAIKKVSRFTLLRLIKSYKNGTYIFNQKAAKYFCLKKTDHFRIEFGSTESVCIDGEISEAQSIEFTVIKKAFNFVLPKKSEFI